MTSRLKNKARQRARNIKSRDEVRRFIRRLRKYYLRQVDDLLVGSVSTGNGDWEGLEVRI